MSVLARCLGVSVVYGGGLAAVAALDGVEFGVAEGERVALLGRSGSGKTILLHVLGGLVEPTSGEVELGSERPAFVFQDANLLPNFTAYENVAFAAHTARGIRRSQLLPRGLLELVGLGDKLDRLPVELSGGEAQRVALARALAQSPQLLLCDEPTGHLDSGTSARVLALINDLQEAYGFALVVATHDPNLAARLDREIELKDGCIVREPVEA
jgi:ABC-type lipoprotein export system ATPase subunit